MGSERIIEDKGRQARVKDEERGQHNIRKGQDKER
jgi:hypothetical protein